MNYAGEVVFKADAQEPKKKMRANLDQIIPGLDPWVQIYLVKKGILGIFDIPQNTVFRLLEGTFDSIIHNGDNNEFEFQVETSKIGRDSFLNECEKLLGEIFDANPENGAAARMYMLYGSLVFNKAEDDTEKETPEMEMVRNMEKPFSKTTTPC